MPTESKPDLRSFEPELRESLIKRRNYWRSRRGQPVEVWDDVSETLVDRDEHVVHEAIARTLAALDHASTSAPVAVAPVADETSAASEPAPVTRPLAELGIDDFRVEAAKVFDGLFDHDRSAPSPFFR